jgi:hypothetical protein
MVRIQSKTLSQVNFFAGTMDTILGFSGKSYEKNVLKKDPGNRENGVHGAWSAGDLGTGKRNRNVRADYQRGFD